jgi:hypothetical protein
MADLSPLDTARRLIRSECRLHVLRAVRREVPLDLEKTLCDQLWQSWRLYLRDDPQGIQALREVLILIKQEVLSEMTHTLEGIDLSSFDENCSVDLLLGAGSS